MHAAKRVVSRPELGLTDLERKKMKWYFYTKKLILKITLKTHKSSFLFSFSKQDVMPYKIFVLF